MTDKLTVFCNGTEQCLGEIPLSQAEERAAELSAQYPEDFVTLGVLSSDGSEGPIGNTYRDGRPIQAFPGGFEVLETLEEQQDAELRAIYRYIADDGNTPVECYTDTAAEAAQEYAERHPNGACHVKVWTQRQVDRPNGWVDVGVREAHAAGSMK